MSRITITPTSARRLRGWRKKLFIMMARNAASPIEHFGLPERPDGDHGRAGRALSMQAASGRTTRRVVSNGGVELAVRESGDADGPTIVFIHGYPDTKEMWSAVLERIPERFHAVAYDVRGAGESSRPRGNAAFDFERLGDDLLAVADACAPGRRVHLVGHDWGGLQGWEFATQPRFEGRLASFTAIAAPSLDQVALGGEELLRRGRVLAWLARLRRSWYIAALLTPGVPTLIWRLGWTPTGGGGCSTTSSGCRRAPTTRARRSPATGSTARSCTAATCRGAR